MVVDCGGGTVDITVHEITSTEGQLKELFKATGGPYGSVSKYISLIGMRGDTFHSLLFLDQILSAESEFLIKISKLFWK